MTTTDDYFVRPLPTKVTRVDDTAENLPYLTARHHVVAKLMGTAIEYYCNTDGDKSHTRLRLLEKLNTLCAVASDVFMLTMTPFAAGQLALEIVRTAKFVPPAHHPDRFYVLQDMVSEFTIKSGGR